MEQSLNEFFNSERFQKLKQNIKDIYDRQKYFQTKYNSKINI